MARLITLALLAALTVAEVAVVLWLVDTLGPGGALLVLALDMLLGMLVMRWGLTSPPGPRGFRIAAGTFIALPGLVLDLVGLALLLSPVQSWVRGHLMRTTEGVLGRSGISVVRVTSGDVIPGSVIPEERGASQAGAPESGASGAGAGDAGVPWPPRPNQGSGMPTDRAGSSPDPGPRVIRGEIES